MTTKNPTTIRWQAEAVAEPGCGAELVRGLLAVLLVQGFTPAARARVGSAVAELCQNVVQHAYPETESMLHGADTLRVQAELCGRRLRVEVVDAGVGFDVAGLGQIGELDTGRSGLARARALSEGLTVASTPGRGTTVTIEFAASSSVFGDERGFDLSELDHLEPALARRLVGELRENGREPRFHLSPALAVCVGRLLAASRPATHPLANTRS